MSVTAEYTRAKSINNMNVSPTCGFSSHRCRSLPPFNQMTAAAATFILLRLTACNLHNFNQAEKVSQYLFRVPSPDSVCAINYCNLKLKLFLTYKICQLTFNNYDCVTICVTFLLQICC
jgi:hypothetical protein